MCAVSDNKIGDKGAKALAPSVALLTNLKELWLNRKLVLVLYTVWMRGMKAVVGAGLRHTHMHTHIHSPNPDPNSHPTLSRRPGMRAMTAPTRDYNKL